MCDRIISPLKGAIQCYCHEGHDILTASDLYQDLQVRQVKGTTAAVCEINRDQVLKVNRIKISVLSCDNFKYDASGVLVFKAYNIGPGELLSWSDLNLQCPALITVK